jgi:hypothetical protein
MNSFEILRFLAATVPKPEDVLKEIKDVNQEVEESCRIYERLLFKTDLADRIKDAIGNEGNKSYLVWLGSSLRKSEPDLTISRLLAALVMKPLLDQIEALRTTVKTMNIVKENNVSDEELKHEEKAAQED